MQRREARAHDGDLRAAVGVAVEREDAAESRLSVDEEVKLILREGASRAVVEGQLD